MDKKAFYSSHDEAADGSGAMALSMVGEMDLSRKIELKGEYWTLGRKLCAVAIATLTDLRSDYGNDVSTVLAMAQYEYWFAASQAAAYMKISISNGNMNDNQRMRAVATPQGYADSYGWANTLSNGFAAITPPPERIALMKENFDREILDQNTALKGMALLWLDEAVSFMRAGRTFEAFDLILEANHALTNMWINKVWDDAFKQGTNEAHEIAEVKARSDLARKASHASHSETRALKSEIESFWRENISPIITNDAAATILIKNFPLSFRKLSEYVSEFKNTPG